MPCDGCARKDLEISLLKQALEGAVYTTPTTSANIARALNLTPQEAELVEIFHRSGPRFLDKWAADDALPRRKDRADADLTTSNVVQVLIVRIRKRLGRDFIETQWGHGFRLSEAARTRVAEILKEAV